MIELPPKIDFWLPPKPAIIRPSTDIKPASFMPGMFPAGAVAAAAVAPLPALAFLQATEDTSNLTTYSFASQNIGAADSTRRVVAVCTWGDSVSARTLSSAIIGGVAATIHVQQGGSGQLSAAAIISALVPTGTTATIDLNFSAEADRASIGVYRAVNETVATPHATATDNTASSGLFSTTVNVPANGWVVAGSGNNGSAGRTMTWTGVTEDYDANFADGAGVNRTGAHQELLALQTGRTISVQSSDTATTSGALAAMSWG